MAYWSFLDILFAPLLKLPPVLAIAIVSLLFSLISILVTKYASNQSEMKRIKEETDKLKKDIKDLRKDPSKLSEMQKKTMEMNKLAMEQFRHSFKPLLITSIPLILFLFPWMSATFAYEPINPGGEFTITATFQGNGFAEMNIGEGIQLLGEKNQEIKDNSASWKLKGQEGHHTIEIIYDDDSQYKDVLITNSNKYLEPLTEIKGKIQTISINYQKNVVIPIGYRNWFGWLGTYILFSLVLSLLLKKTLSVY